MAQAQYQSLPFREQVTFFRNKVNVPTATWRDVWRDQHDKAFMVAGAAKADLLDDFRQAIDRAIAEGTTIAEFRKDFDRIVETYGWSYNGGRGWRTRVIYETNLRTSYQAGRYAQLTDPDLLLSRPFWRYKHSDSVQHPRPLHVSWNGLILKHDDPWWATHFPPNGWGCKCKVFAESERSMKRRGKSQPDQAPGDSFSQGIDDGWDYAPGASVAEQTRRQIRKKADKLPPKLKADLSQAINSIPKPSPLPDRKLPKTEVFSTVKKVNTQSLNSLLERIPGAEDQISKLAEFIDTAGVKSLFIKQTEMGTGKTAFKIKDQIADYLGTNNAWGLYNSPRAKNANGFTFDKYRHVVVKNKASDDLSKVDGDVIKDSVEFVLAATTIDSGPNSPIWSFRAAFNQFTKEKQPGQVVTWIHEMSHQIHFAAGKPKQPDHLTSLTRYGAANHYEWHAEHIAAWVINRDALKQREPEIVDYIDKLVDKAIEAVKKES